MLWSFTLPCVHALEHTNNKTLQLPQQFNIPQQPLDSALIVFSKQSGIQLIIATAIDPQLLVPSITGKFKPLALLQQLLANSGLDYERTGQYTVIIHRAHHEVTQAGVLEEVLVTVRKRKQKPENVSIALTVFNRFDIGALGISRSQALVSQVPALTVKSPYATNNPVFTIRGVGYNNFSSNTNSSIGFYVDDFYLNSSSLLNFDLFDIERIEVLRGPQGTLFGRNTVGGAIGVVTRSPEQVFDAYLHTDIGNYQYLAIKGAVGGGINENLSTRFAFSSRRQREGFYINDLNANNHGELGVSSWRASVLWTPEPALEVQLKLYNFQDRSEQWYYQVFGTQDPQISTQDPLLGTVFKQPCQAWVNDRPDLVKTTCVNLKGYRDSDGDAFRGRYSLDPITQSDTEGAIVRVNRTLGSAKLQAITGYQQFERILQEEFDGSPFLMGDNEQNDDIQSFSQELRFVSVSNGVLDWILGGIYSVEHIDASVLTSGKDRWGTDLLIDYRQATASQAVFTHLEWSVSTQWRLLVGARYSYDRIRFDGSTQNLDPYNNGVVTALGVAVAPGIVTDINSSISYGAWSGKLGIDYQPEAHQLWYAHISRAYKSGGYTGFWSILPEDGAPYDEETLIAFELGLKWQIPHSHLVLSTAAYYYDYQDLQQSIPTIAGTFQVSNVGSIISTGLESEIHWQPIDHLTLTLGASYIDAAYSNDSFDGVQNLGGNVPVNSPEKAINTALKWSLPLTNRFTLSLIADAAYQSKVYLSVANRETESQESYWLYNGRISLVNDADHWEVALWGKNLADKQYIIEAFSSLSSGSSMRVGGAPATFGLSVNYTWK